MVEGESEGRMSARGAIVAFASAIFAVGAIITIVGLWGLGLFS